MKQELKPSVRMNVEAKKKLEVIQLKTHRSLTALLDRAVRTFAPGSVEPANGREI